MPRSNPTKTQNINILFTCIGRRVSLLKSFRKAAKQLKVKATFVGTDTTNLSSALQLCDKKYIVDSISHPDYLKQLLEIVTHNKIKLLIPTIDTDLILLAKNKPKFTKLGCHVLISEPNIVEICRDKRKTHRFLIKNDFDSPATTTVNNALAQKNHTWPLLLKPWDGAAARNVTVVHNRKELLVFGNRIKNCIVQEFIKGAEYTCDVFVDSGMKVRCVVPRKRIKVRDGEVSKGQIVKNNIIMTRVAQVVEKLGAGPGIITIQLILTPKGQTKFIEINPRFGGGIPLAIKAGANFPKWILQQFIGQKPHIKFDGFKNNLTMLRYDAEVWLES